MRGYKRIESLSLETEDLILPILKNFWGQSNYVLYVIILILIIRIAIDDTNNNNNVTNNHY